MHEVDDRDDSQHGLRGPVIEGRICLAPARE
jgi:hypothetical protein